MRNVLRSISVRVNPNNTITIHAWLGTTTLVRYFPHTNDRLRRLSGMRRFLTHVQGYSARPFCTDSIGWVLEAPTEANHA